MRPLAPYRTSTAMRLVVLFTLFFFFLLTAGGIGAAASLIPGIGARGCYLISSTAQCLIAFCIPAWFTARFSTSHPWLFLGVARNPGFLPFVGVIIVYCLALPAMNQLIAWNESIHFPQWASDIENTLRELEEANGQIAKTILEMNSLSQFVVTLLVVGGLTGFSEELFFRGCLQHIFVDGNMKRQIAIWCTAFIFSAMHFQFFGFVPRLIMGAFFGYLFVWSGSLWPAIFAHMLNNSIVVVGAWLTEGSQEWKLETLGVPSDGGFPLTALASLVATALFFYYFRGVFFKGRVNGKEK